MKRLLQYAGIAMLLTFNAAAQETDNINNRYGPPNYTGGTTPTTSESFAAYQQHNANLSRTYQRTTAPILEVYPNPTATYTRIILSDVTTQPVTVSVVNLNGVLVRSYQYGAGAGRFDIDVSSLPEGLYALQIQERGKEAQSVQLSKVRD